METAEGSKQTNTVVAFHLQSDAADGQRRIDAFVDAAYAHYQARPAPESCPGNRPAYRTSLVARVWEQFLRKYRLFEMPYDLAGTITCPWRNVDTQPGPSVPHDWQRGHSLFPQQ